MAGTRLPTGFCAGQALGLAWAFPCWASCKGGRPIGWGLGLIPMSGLGVSRFSTCFFLDKTCENSRLLGGVGWQGRKC